MEQGSIPNSLAIHTRLEERKEKLHTSKTIFGRSLGCLWEFLGGSWGILESSEGVQGRSLGASLVVLGWSLPVS